MQPTLGVANDALPNGIHADTLRISSYADEQVAVEHAWVQHVHWMNQSSP
ncbi:hypothetical protein ABT001_08580 [Streptomyces sp. NPDC002793]